MLKVNQGLKSRFSTSMYFKDLTPDAAAHMLRKKVEAQGFALSPAASAAAADGLAALAALPGFGNGRDIDTVAQRLFTEVAMRGASGSAAAAEGGGSDDDDTEVTEKDLGAAIEWLAAKRRPAGGAAAPSAQGLPAAADAPAGAYERLQNLAAIRGQQQAEFATATPPPPPQLATVKAVVQHQKQEEVQQQVPPPDAQPQQGADPWEGMPPAFLTGLQSALDTLGLNSLEAVRRLAALPSGSDELSRLAVEIATRAGISTEAAAALLTEWQKKYGSVEEGLRQQEEEMQKAKGQGRMAMVPIWRCAVCGRADKPWIACYVSPFIVRFQPTVLP